MKGQEREPAEKGDRYPLLLPPSLQRRLFLDEIERRAPVDSERQVLDAYLTSLFNAWLDNQNLFGTEKRWVVAFVPRMAWGAGGERFFAAYPDGRLISIVRDPRGWLTSSRGRQKPEERDPSVKRALEDWLRSTREAIEAKRRYGDQVAVVAFEDLVLAPASTMRDLARWLEIEDDPQLAMPTFNRLPVGANSSFVVREPGVLQDPLTRYRDELGEADLATVARTCDSLHREALDLRDVGARTGSVSA